MTQKIFNRSIAAVAALACVCTIGLSSCYDDSGLRGDIKKIDERVTKLEKQQKDANAEITAIKATMEAVKGQKSVDRVEVLKDADNNEIGHTIHFVNGDPKSIDIKHGNAGNTGNAGDTPLMGVQDVDGVLCWTVKLGDNAPELLKADGKNIPVTGDKGADAVAPTVRIENGIWEISTDGGVTFASTGVKATGEQGDSMFEDVKLEEGIVTIKLKDGQEFKLDVTPQEEIFFGFTGGADTFVVTDDNKTIPIMLGGFKRGEVEMTVKLTLENENYSIFTRATTKNAEGKFIVDDEDNCIGATVTINQKADYGTKGVLEVSLIEKSVGAKLSIARVVEFATSEGFVAQITAGQPEITLLADVEVAEELKLTSSTKLDLNGKTLKAKSIRVDNGDNVTNLKLSNGKVEITGTTVDDRLMFVTPNSKLTIDKVEITSALDAIQIGAHKDRDVTGITASISNSTITSAGTGIVVSNKDNKVNLVSCTINHGRFGITQNGTVPGSTVTLFATDIAGKYTGIYLSNHTTGQRNVLTVVGGTITSREESAIEVRKTDITVTGATLKSEATEQSYGYTTDGSNGIGYGIVLAATSGSKDVASESVLVEKNVKYVLAAGETAQKVYTYNPAPPAE